MKYLHVETITITIVTFLDTSVSIIKINGLNINIHTYISSIMKIPKAKWIQM